MYNVAVIKSRFNFFFGTSMSWGIQADEPGICSHNLPVYLVAYHYDIMYRAS